MSALHMSREVKEVIYAALAAGKLIKYGHFSSATTPEAGTEKQDPNVGHHAIVTSADAGSQKFILTVLEKAYPRARFIVEEKSDVCLEKIISDETVGGSVDEPLIFNVDPLDGTSTFNAGLYEWAVSIGVMREKLYHAGGAIFAPDVRDGMLVYGERCKGVFLKEQGQGNAVAVKAGGSIKKNALVYIGPDIFFMLDRFGNFLNTISKEIRTTNCNGSCALTLAAIAAGKISALIQPVQCPWDWAAGYPLVEEAGGKVIFYHYPTGKPELLELNASSYSPTKRNVAFIAGIPEIVDWLWALLQEHWIEKKY